MRVIDEWDCRFPEWAIIAQEYGDYSGMSDEDTKMLHDWQRRMGEAIKKAYSPTAKWNVIFTSDTNDFDSHPEFGKPCATNSARIVIFDREEAQP